MVGDIPDWLSSPAKLVVYGKVEGSAWLRPPADIIMRHHRTFSHDLCAQTVCLHVSGTRLLPVLLLLSTALFLWVVPATAAAIVNGCATDVLVRGVGWLSLGSVSFVMRRVVAPVGIPFGSPVE